MTFQFGLRQKMVLVLITVLTLSLGLTGWYAIYQQENKIVQQTRQHGEDLARSTVQSLVYTVIGYNYHAIQLLLEEIVTSRDIDYAKLVNSKGNIMAEVGKLSLDTPPWTIFTQDIVFDNNVIGELVLGLDNASIVTQIKQQRNAIIQREVILILFIAIGEFMALSYIIIRPVIKISNALDDNIGEYGHIIKDIPIQSHDEFGRLAMRFNSMRAQLNKLTSELHSKVNLANKEVQLQNSQLITQSTELLSINLKLEKLTLTDPLTELYNRRHFDILMESEFSYAIRKDESFSIIILDLDNFKQINDTFGHSEGDKVLRAIANTINENIRISDITCRIGGEEFAILCRHTDAKEVMVMVEKMRMSLNENRIKLNTNTIYITASFGVMTMPSDDIEIDSPHFLFRCADKAMYYSKDNGKNRVTHFNDITNKVDMKVTHFT